MNITLGKRQPLKKRYVGANQSPFMNKRLSKAITEGSRLRILDTKTDTGRKVYKKQLNCVVSLPRK